MIYHHQILGVILAGGQSQRMNYNPKWRLILQQQTVIEHIIDKFAPQVSQVIINGSHPLLEKLPYPVICDSLTGGMGPLAGILTGLEYAQQQGFAWLATCPCDTPFLPNSYVDILANAIAKTDSTNTTGAIVKSGDHIHGVFGLWSVKLAVQLRRLLETKDVRSIRQWTQKDAHTLTVEIVEEKNAFFNINTPKDWQRAQSIYIHSHHNK
ncbi:molybdenum cofactor guanylyltransferase [Candidatus Endobugula sertula]|uniref:Molybdenum cofactor guanylyltransferase n=1 Tax=Candidatus Endobugula sertula TaxID=62101 RepID=A0A1D2QND4_9GAMM|nr:molybdenum cofactor guanylyltransferase [Candidatus Endobugula sertula]